MSFQSVCRIRLVPAIFPFFLMVFLLCGFAGFAQVNSTQFSALSKTAYSKKIAELKQRKIPVAYTDKKEQKTYEGILRGRNEGLLADFENDQLLDDTLLLNKCRAILHRLMPVGSKFPEDSISVYLYRSTVANACCHGEGTLYVNLGLFLWIDNDDELAFILAHELSHQLLDHVESRIRKNMALISSEEFIDEMKAIRKSSTGKYERFKSLMKDLVTQNGTHSRYKESEADSLAIVLVRNAGYNAQLASLVLLKLDKVGELFTANNLYDRKAAFEKAGARGFITEKKARYNGLSMANVTMNADKDFDSVKTHPDCIIRYKKTAGATETVPVDCCSKVTPSYVALKEHALKEIIRYEYESNRLTLCSHLCLFALHNGLTGSFYSDFLALSFAGMYEADKHLEKFSVTDAKAKAGSSLKELQDDIFNANSEKLADASAAFLSAASTFDSSSEDYQFAKMKYDTEVKSTDVASAENLFLLHSPTASINIY